MSPTKHLEVSKGKPSDWSIVQKPGIESVDQTMLEMVSFRHQTPALDVRGADVQHQNHRPSGPGFGFSLTSLLPHYLLTVTTSSDDGPKTSATERGRRCFSEVERGYRRSKPCKGSIEHRSGQGRFWFNQRPPPNDQSKSHTIPSIAG